MHLIYLLHLSKYNLVYTQCPSLYEKSLVLDTLNERDAMFQTLLIHYLLVLLENCVFSAPPMFFFHC